MILHSSQIEMSVASACEKETAIAAAYLFGSYAKGTPKRSSDLDIALLLNESETDTFSLPRFITALEKKTGYKVDAVILNNAGEVLKHEIRREGILLFERSSTYRKQFEVKSRKFFEDFLYLHKNYVKKILYGKRNGRSNPY
jgi:predicted nucleotidyltransferase